MDIETLKTIARQLRKFFSVIIVVVLVNCDTVKSQAQGSGVNLSVIHDERAGTISVYGNNGKDLVLTQHAKPGIRPYIHPIMSPDGKSELTEFSPAHHKHQTGLYWGLKQVNGRDYFMNWKSDYWKMVSARVIEESGSRVKWQTVYDLLDERGNSILRETHTWTLQERNEKYLLDLEWKGDGSTDVTMGEFYVGGLFLRMPWRAGVRGEVVNAVGQKNSEGEGQRAIWNDVGVQVPGRDDLVHIAMLDHPDNKDFPIPWRVDNELGVGPSRQILGDWKISKGESETIKYRLVVYTGDLNPDVMTNMWREYVCE